MRFPNLEDKYEIVRPLGEGGMGVVYLAVQKPLNRKVAIKSIAPYLARDPQIRERFATEAAVLARLNHPNIVTLYDYIEEKDALYLIMEYVEGQPLSELLQGGALPLELVQKYFTQILEAFSYAHEQGIIHRDIKASNIMITAGGRVKILDFGVARLLESDHSLTRTGMRIGTLLYMSPEQVKGEKNIDHRSDIYSLGVLLYEMLMGRPPYPADISEFNLSIKIVQEPLFDLSRPPEGIPTPLIEVILKATEKNPEYRYSSCVEFLEDFRRALGKKEEEVSSVAPTQMHFPELKKASRKRGIWIGIAAGGVFVLLLAFAWLWWRGQSIENEDAVASVDTVRTLARGMADTIVSSGPPTESPQSTFVPEDTSGKKSASTGSLPSPSISQPPKQPLIPASKRTPQPSVSSAPPASTPVSKPRIETDIQNFKESSLAQLKAKGILVVRNVGQGEATAVTIALHFLDKKGNLEYTDTLTVSGLRAGESRSIAFQARVNGIKSVRVEVLSVLP